MAEEAAPGPPPPSRFLRICYAVIQSVTLSVFVALCWLAKNFEKVFAELEMKNLPLPTELFITLAKVVRTPPGSTLMGLLCAGLVFLGLRGTFDGRLRKLIVLNVIGAALVITLFLNSLYLPILQIQKTLESK